MALPLPHSTAHQGAFCLLTREVYDERRPEQIYTYTEPILYTYIDVVCDTQLSTRCATRVFVQKRGEMM